MFDTAAARAYNSRPETKFLEGRTKIWLFQLEQKHRILT
jgi:hypothetical protein